MCWSRPKSAGRCTNVTLVVGISVGYYAIVAADSRAHFFGHDGSTTIDDAIEKVRETPHGLASGAGSLEATFGSIQGICDEEPERLRDPHRVGEYLANFWGAFTHARDQWVTDERGRGTYVRNGWVFTRRVDEEVLIWMNHTDQQCAPTQVAHGIPVALLPNDMTAMDSEPLERDLMRSVRRCRGEHDVDRTLEYNIRCVAKLMKRASGISQVLGPGIQIGLHFAEGTIDLLPIEPLEAFKV
jgi:hypothetical protein